MFLTAENATAPNGSDGIGGPEPRARVEGGGPTQHAPEPTERPSVSRSGAAPVRTAAQLAQHLGHDAMPRRPPLQPHRGVDVVRAALVVLPLESRHRSPRLASRHAPSLERPSMPRKN